MTLDSNLIAEVVARAAREHTALSSLLTGRSAAPAPPASEADLTRAEQRLGFAIPADLAQLYRDVGNGGFGPGGGLRPLGALVDAFDERRTWAEDDGENHWPKRLLPMVPLDPGDLCLDAETGTVIEWDPEMIEEGRADEYARSFIARFAALEAWLEDWLRSETAGDAMERLLREQASKTAQVAIDYYTQAGADARAAAGLPEVGWQDELRRSHGAA
jgi:hypothetical protein